MVKPPIEPSGDKSHCWMWGEFDQPCDTVLDTINKALTSLAETTEPYPDKSQYYKVDYKKDGKYVHALRKYVSPLKNDPDFNQMISKPDDIVFW